MLRRVKIWNFNEDISIATYCCNFMYNFFFQKTKYCKKYFFLNFLINFSSYLNDAVSLLWNYYSWNCMHMIVNWHLITGSFDLKETVKQGKKVYLVNPTTVWSVKQIALFMWPSQHLYKLPGTLKCVWCRCYTIFVKWKMLPTF